MRLGALHSEKRAYFFVAGRSNSLYYFSVHDDGSARKIEHLLVATAVLIASLRCCTFCKDGPFLRFLSSTLIARTEAPRPGK